MREARLGPLIPAALVFTAILSSSRILVAGAYESLWKTLWYGDLFPSVAGVAAFAGYAMAGSRIPPRLHGVLVTLYAIAGGLTDNVEVLYIPAGLALAAGLWLASSMPPYQVAAAAALGASLDVAARLAAAGAEPWDSPLAPLYSAVLAAGGVYSVVRPLPPPPGPGWGLYYWLAAAELGSAYPNAALRLAGVDWYTPSEAGAAGLLVAAGYIGGALAGARAAVPASVLGVAVLALPWPFSLAWAPLLAAGSTAALALGGRARVLGPVYFIALMVAAVGVYAYPYLGLWPLADKLEAVIAASLAALLPVARASTAAPWAPGHAALPAALALAACLTGALALVLQAEPVTSNPAASRELVVVSYNVHQGFTPDGSLNAADIVFTIESIGADVVCLQEVDGGRLTSAYTDLPLLLMVRGWDYAYQPAIEGAYGVAVVSKHGVDGLEGLLLPSRGEQRAAVKAAAYGVVVVNAHLGLEPEERVEQARALLEAALRPPVALVLCGDFNEEEGAAIRLLSTYYTLPDPGTYTCCLGEDFKGVIDYVGVLAGSGASITWYSTVYSDASDHLPVVARIRLGQPPG